MFVKNGKRVNMDRRNTDGFGFYPWSSSPCLHFFSKRSLGKDVAPCKSTSCRENKKIRHEFHGGSWLDPLSRMTWVLYPTRRQSEGVTGRKNLRLCLLPVYIAQTLGAIFRGLRSEKPRREVPLSRGEGGEGDGSSD